MLSALGGELLYLGLRLGERLAKVGDHLQLLLDGFDRRCVDLGVVQFLNLTVSLGEHYGETYHVYGELLDPLLISCFEAFQLAIALRNGVSVSSQLGRLLLQPLLQLIALRPQRVR